MPLISLLYSIVSRFLIWLAPIILVLSSVAWNLPNKELHKQTLVQTQFYAQLSKELQAINPQDASSDKGFGFFLVTSVVSDLATESWLRQVVEKNIDLIVDWLDGDLNEFVMYIPSKDIENSVNKKIDSSAKSVSKQVPVCDAVTAEKIKREGFDWEKNFCLPKPVKEGGQNLTQYFGAKNSKDNLIDTLVKDNRLNILSERFRAADLDAGNLVTRINPIRDAFLTLRQFVPYLLVMLVILLICNLFLARAVNKGIFRELRRVFFFVGINTLILSATFVLIVAGSAYLNSSINSFLLPGIATTKIINLIAWQFVLFALTLVSTSIAVAVGLIIINLISWVIAHSGIFDKAKSRNSKLQRRLEPTPDGVNDTLDGKFRTTLQNQRISPEPTDNLTYADPENFNTPAGSSDFNYDYLAQNPQIAHSTGNPQFGSFQNVPVNTSDISGFDPTIANSQWSINPEQKIQPTLPPRVLSEEEKRHFAQKLQQENQENMGQGYRIPEQNPSQRGQSDQSLNNDAPVSAPTQYPEDQSNQVPPSGNPPTSMGKRRIHL